MAKLYVTEYRGLGTDSIGRLMAAPVEPEITTQVLDFGGGEQKSQPFNNETRLVYLHTDAICSVLFGSDPTAAAANNKRLAANEGRFFAVTGGMKVSVITNT